MPKLISWFLFRFLGSARGLITLFSSSGLLALLGFLSNLGFWGMFWLFMSPFLVTLFVVGVVYFFVKRKNCST